MRLFITTLCLIFSLALTAEVYRSVDKNGNVVFTDQPSPDAELIELDELQTIDAPSTGNFEYTPPPEKPAPRYSAVTIISPQNDVAIRDNAGNVTVNIATQPDLRSSDELVLFMDGKEIILGKSTAKALTALDRGTHQLRAAIRDANGRILQSSPSVIFHLLRQSK
jgi:uncharacterized protein DUF4124